MTLEQLDPAWGRCLTQALRTDAPPFAEEADLALPLEQLLVTLLYRHLPGALEDGDLAGRTALCVLCWQVLVHLLRVRMARCTGSPLEELLELARMLSAEIEYSDENITALLDFLT